MYNKSLHEWVSELETLKTVSSTAIQKEDTNTNLTLRFHLNEVNKLFLQITCFVDTP